MSMQFQNQLISLRKKKGVSQEFLADKLYVSRQTISKWELGETTPDLENLVNLASFFEISLDELVFNESTVKNLENEVVKPPKTIIDLIYDFWWLIFIILCMGFVTIQKLFW